MTFNLKKKQTAGSFTVNYVIYSGGADTHFQEGGGKSGFYVSHRQWRIQEFHGGDNSQSGCANLLIYNFFAENCMKMKEFGLRGGRVPGSANACTKGMY